MATNLRQLRELTCISQATLAEAIGVSQQSIYKYENGYAEPDIDTLKKIADYFETTVDYLIGRDGQELEQIEDMKELSVMEEYKSLDDYQRNVVKSTIKALKKKN